MEKYIAMVDKHRERILGAFDYIWKNPESACVDSAKVQFVACV